MGPSCLPSVSSQSAAASNVSTLTMKLLKSEGEVFAGRLEDCPSPLVTVDNAPVICKWLALAKKNVVRPCPDCTQSKLIPPGNELDLKDVATARHSTCVMVQEPISSVASSHGTSGSGNNKGTFTTPSRVSGSSSGSKNTASLTVTYMNDEQVWSLRQSWYQC